MHMYTSITKKVAGVALVLAMALGFGAPAFASVRVHGYTTKRGTYVNSYTRTSPDSTRYNNYSHKGNYNPYTGKKGYKY